MKNKFFELYHLDIEFLCYTRMKNFIYSLLSSDYDSLIKTLKRDLSVLRDCQKSLVSAFTECKRQIEFIENFLDDYVVND